MPDAPWRCSQCGTVNEPAATSCRGCGRWPSLFDLQDDAVGGISSPDEAPAREVPRWDPPALETESAAEAAVPASAPEPPPVAPTQAGTRPSRRRRPRGPAQRLVRLIIPVAALLYFLISSYVSNH